MRNQCPSINITVVSTRVEELLITGSKTSISTGFVRDTHKLSIVRIFILEHQFIFYFHNLAQFPRVHVLYGIAHTQL